MLVGEEGGGGCVRGGRTKTRTIQVSITVRWAGRMEKADMLDWVGGWSLRF